MVKTISQIIREKSRNNNNNENQNKDDKKDDKKIQKILSIEEQIALLESQIQSNSDDSDSESNSDSEDDSDSDSEDDEPKNKKFKSDVSINKIIEKDNDLLVEKDTEGNVLKLTSTLLVEEKIDPLSSKYLPAKTCGSTSKTNSNNKPRTISFADEKQSNKPPVNNSLKYIESYLKSNVLKNEEKKPFFCRYCQFQGKDLDSYQDHIKNDPQHLKMMDYNRKVLCCRICKKNFNSIEQLNEHKSGKAHQERLNNIKNYQEMVKNNNNNGRKFERY